MKKINFLFLLFFLMITFSCQNEENEIIKDDKNSLTAEAPLYRLVERVAQNPTSRDNILDNSSCFAVVLPVEVIVNGQQIQVNNTDDYQLVQDAIDAFTTDDDIVNFIFPITIQFQNFDTQIIDDIDALEEVLEDCDEDEDFNEIDCISINYPITINTYDSNNQIASTVTIESDDALFDFFNNLEDTMYVGINYPISITNSNGQNIVITSNEMLEEAIEEAIMECNVSGLTLESVITDGTWYISYFFKNNVDQTTDFEGYNLTFFINGDMNVAGNGNDLDGGWEINSNASERKLEIELDGDLLLDLEEKWKVIEYTTTYVKLRLVGQGNGGNNYMYLSKN
ncbi:hypothetical protein [Flavobacterium sp.]|uniref:hypothetical protein n=1 Tax=Flavobacterium sp. TaxID=239 RepID=UPI0025BDCDB2|nr:hypothetical protein [Flavobacterium sp.]